MNKDKIKAIRTLLGYTTDLRVNLPNTRAVRDNIYDYIDKNMYLFTNIRYEDDKDMYCILLYRYTQFVIEPRYIDMFDYR